MDIKTFCTASKITEAQFYGKEKIVGDLNLENITSLPEGFKPTISGSLSFLNLESVPRDFCPTIGGDLDFGYYDSDNLYETSLESLSEGFKPTIGGSLNLSFLKSLPKGFSPVVRGNLKLGRLKSLPDGFNPAVGGHLYLDSIESLPKGFSPVVGGHLYLHCLESLPEGFNPTVGGNLHLYSLNSLPEGLVLKVDGKIQIGFPSSGIKYLIDVTDEGKSIDDLVRGILNSRDLPKYNSITIGRWGDMPADQPDCQPILDMFAENPEKFAHVDTLYIGEMSPLEADLGWITQGDYSGLLKAMPQLKSLTIQGTSNLNLGKMKLEKLTHLEIIGGGLKASVLKDLSQSKLPNLETLILYLGENTVDSTRQEEVENITSLLSKDLFPKLSTLGLVNSKIQDEVVAAVMQSDILPQLTELQFCYGILTNKGGQAILDSVNKITHLEYLNLEYHFLTKEMVEELKKLPIKINSSNAQYDSNESSVGRHILYTDYSGYGEYDDDYDDDDYDDDYDDDDD